MVIEFNLDDMLCMNVFMNKKDRKYVPHVKDCVSCVLFIYMKACVCIIWEWDSGFMHFEFS